MDDDLVELLARNGFVAAEEEAAELLASAAGDAERLGALVARRLTGEPLAWITGSVEFCGLTIRVDPGVYVPRWQTEPLARRAAERLPADGVAVDVCTGSGAVAKVLTASRPGARVVASDLDERAVACARANGVEAYRGDLFAPLPEGLAGRVDVVVGVVPYVPTPDLPLLQRDTFTFEPERFYDGGADGTTILRRVLAGAQRFLRPGGALALELGGRQAEALRDDLARLGYADVAVLLDEDGDPRGIEATYAGTAAVDLYWIPLGAGGHSVRFNGRVYEALAAARGRRPRLDLYHAALVIELDGERYTLEVAPSPDAGEASRGVVATGAVGSRRLGALRLFRYEVRCWPGGSIPDLEYAAGAPCRLTSDPQVARRALDAVAAVPTPVWGRDELKAGEMWNSNSMIAWVIATAGLPAERLRPPPHGRAPGWDAGLEVARRSLRP